MATRQARKRLSIPLPVILAICILGIAGCNRLKPGGDLSKADLSGEELQGIDLNGADLSKAILKDTDLSNANLAGVNFEQADLEGANLAGANLSGADFTTADLSYAVLNETNLNNADLRGADLSHAFLKSSNLSDANLYQANFTEADLSYADLRSTQLAEADLTTAKLIMTNLTGAQGLSESAIASGISQGAILGAETMHGLLGKVCQENQAIPGAEGLKDVEGTASLVLLHNTGEIFHDTRIPVSMLGEIRFAACVRETKEVVDSCGPYSFLGLGGSESYASLVRLDARVKIVDVRTGTVIAEETFEGQDPGGCPYSICYGCNSIEGPEMPVGPIREFAAMLAEAWPVYIADSFDSPKFDSEELASDELDANENGWSIGEFENEYMSGERSLEFGKYMWQVKSVQSGGTFEFLDIDPVSDFYAAVEVEPFESSLSQKQGLVFGAVDPANFNVFVLSGDGQFQVLSLVNLQWRNLIGPSSSPIVRTGEPNRLAVRSEGTVQAFYINDILVAELNDSNLNRLGNVGLVAELDEANDFAILDYDNFELHVPYADQRLLLESANELAQDGNLSRALEIYERVVEAEPSFEIPASSWNTLCWFGSLWDKAEEVMTACENAVEAAIEQGSGYFALSADSRGVARSLTGDYGGAVEDFQIFVATYEQDDALQEPVALRRAWIAELESGRNPFDEQTLEAMRGRPQS